MIEWMGVGLPERDAPQRALAIVVLFVVGLVWIGGFIYMVFYWPLWIALPAGLILMTIGTWISLVVIDRIVGKKVKTPHSRYDDR